MRLTRTVRFNHNIDGASSGSNGFGGVPTNTGFGAWSEVEITCQGFPDPETGYLVDIKEIDSAARTVLYPKLFEHPSNATIDSPASRLLKLMVPLGASLSSRFDGTLVSARWWVTPTLSFEVEMNDQAEPTTAVLRQRSEFAASHRLHVPSMDDASNRKLFGKCNNANGHGHNYVVEPAVVVTPGTTPPPVTVEGLEQAVERAILARFDHKHLNLDTEIFGPEGLNPTVENISKVCFELLREELGEVEGARLRSVTVWETDRTCCTYPG